MTQVIKFLFVFLILVSRGSVAVCQDTTSDNALIEQMLLRIAAIQQNHEKDFPAGMIPTYRTPQKRTALVKNDDNIFFTGLVVFTLRYLYPYLNQSAQTICDSIFARALPLYDRHRNRKGRFTYNYWQTARPVIFPHGGLLNLFNRSQALPDDMDVTSIVLLAASAPDSTVAGV